MIDTFYINFILKPFLRHLLYDISIANDGHHVHCSTEYKIGLADESLVTIDGMGVKDDEEGEHYKDRSILSEHTKDGWELYPVKLHAVRFLSRIDLLFKISALILRKTEILNMNISTYIQDARISC